MARGYSNTASRLVYDDGVLVFGRGLDGWLDEVRWTAEVLHPEQFLRTCRFFSDPRPRLPTVAMLDQTPTRVQSALKLAWPKIGTLTPKSINEIETSMWSLGCETLDRDLADWDACASEEVQYALSGIDWTEYSHAKWNARRMLCDLGHGVESSVFTISDVSYHKDFISRYGLLKTNSDNSILKVKTANYTVQNVVAVFNDALERVTT